MAKSRSEKPADPPHDQHAAPLPPALEDRDELDGLAPDPLDVSPNVPPPRPTTTLRQGDQHRPLCPVCSTPEQPVLMTAASSRDLFTWYACPTAGCAHRVKLPRPNIKRLLGRDRSDSDFSAR